MDRDLFKFWQDCRNTYFNTNTYLEVGDKFRNSSYMCVVMQ